MWMGGVCVVLVLVVLVLVQVLVVLVVVVWLLLVVGGCFGCVLCVVFGFCGCEVFFWVRVGKTGKRDVHIMVSNRKSRNQHDSDVQHTVQQRETMTMTLMTRSVSSLCIQLWLALMARVARPWIPVWRIAGIMQKERSRCKHFRLGHEKNLVLSRVWACNDRRTLRVIH